MPGVVFGFVQKQVTLTNLRRRQEQGAAFGFIQQRVGITKLRRRWVQGVAFGLAQTAGDVDKSPKEGGFSLLFVTLRYPRMQEAWGLKARLVWSSCDGEQGDTGEVFGVLHREGP